MEEKPTSGKDPKPHGETDGSGFVEGLKTESSNLDKKPARQVSEDELLYQQVRVEEHSAPKAAEALEDKAGESAGSESTPARKKKATVSKEQEKQKPSRVRAFVGSLLNFLGSIKKHFPKQLVQTSYFSGIEIRPVRTATYAFFLTSLFYVFCNSVFLYWMNSIFDKEDQGWGEFRAVDDTAATNSDYSEFAIQQQEVNQTGVNALVLDEDLFSTMVAPVKGGFPISAQVVEMYRAIDNDENAPARRAEQLRGLLVSNTRWYERWKPLTTAISRPPSGIDIVNRLGADESGDDRSGWETRLGTRTSKEEIKNYMADMIAHLNTSMTTPRRWLIRLGGSWVQWIIILTAFFTLVLVWRRWRLVDAQSTIIQKWSSGRNLAEKKTDDSEPSDPDEISVAREGEAIVPYSREKAKEYFASGQLLPTDWGWHDGMDEWKPINEVLGVAAPAQTSATTVQGNGNWASLSEGWASSRASKTWAVKQLDSRGNPLHGIVKASIVHHLDGKPESELEDKIETRVGQVKEDLEKKCYTLLMYLLGALPSLGFIGTLLGIGAALTKTNSLFEASDSVSKQQSMNEITYQLGIAFDTTLIALVASLFVGLIIQWLKGQEFRMIEEFSSKISSDIVPELYRKLKPTGTDEE